MRLVIKALSLLIIYIIVSGIITLSRRPKNAEKGKVYLSKSLVIIGLIGALFSLSLTLIAVFSDESVWLSVVFLIFALLSSSLIIAYINCRISYDKEGFVVKNFFGFKKYYKYNQVTGFMIELNHSYIFAGKHKIMIDTMSVGIIEFMDFVHRQYTKLNKCKLPYIERSKNDLFKGHIASPGEFIFVYVTLGIVALLFLGFVIWLVYWPASVDNTIEKQVVFKNYTVYDGDIVLTSLDNQKFKITIAEEKINFSGIKELCDGKSNVTVYCKEVNPKDEDNYYNIKAFECDGVYLLSFEKYNEIQRQEGWPIILVTLIIDLFLVWFIIASIVVGRNPKKYGRKIVGIFFKNSYVSY